MKKVFLLTTAVLISVIGIFSCDLLGIVPDIEPGSLEAAVYTNLPASEEDALELLSDALSGAGSSISMGLGTKLASALANIDSRSAAEIIFAPLLSSDSGIPLEVYGAAPKSVTASGSSSATDLDFSLTIKNETVYGAISGGSGSATIDSFTVKVKGGVNDDFTGGEGRASVNGAVEFSQFEKDNASPVIITDGKIDVLGNATASYTIAGTSITAAYNANVNIKAGLSISGDVGGKIIFTFTYKDNTSITVDASSSDSESIAESALENLQLLATLEIYDNSDQLQNSYTWNQEDLLDIYDDMQDLFGS